MSDNPITVALRGELARVLRTAAAADGDLDAIDLRDLARVLRRIGRAIDAVGQFDRWNEDASTPAPREPPKPVVHLIDGKTVACGLRAELRATAGDTLTILPDDATCPACKRAMKPASEVEP